MYSWSNAVQTSLLKGKFTQNDNFIYCSVRGAESNGEGLRFMR